ncbi:MAG: hypothetical protein HDT39_03340 [Lachnospiraceae bacterium]|nr:hypothetical protein [Lachnospiraceae bacterium]
MTDGLHTFYIYKVSKDSYRSYNWEGQSHVEEKNKLDDFNNGSGFIVGYIAWK